MFTCTGRISMHEPNLQNVPRTFSIPSEYLSLDSSKCDDILEFNCRNIFKAAPGYVIVSADYCQLEMRILTHFSKDPVLTEIMNSDMDVFKSIAATWSNVPEEEVRFFIRLINIMYFLRILMSPSQIYKYILILTFCNINIIGNFCLCCTSLKINTRKPKHTYK